MTMNYVAAVKSSTKAKLCNTNYERFYRETETLRNCKHEDQHSTCNKLTKANFRLFVNSPQENHSIRLGNDEEKGSSYLHSKCIKDKESDGQRKTLAIQSRKTPLLINYSTKNTVKHGK